MFKKLSLLPALIRYSLFDFFSGLKKDERGLSGVVVAVLLILVAVLAVALIWGFLSGWLADMWNRIFGEADSIS